MRSSKEPSEWTEKDWMEHLYQRASRLMPDAHTAADLAMECLRAFHDRFRHYPWQHPDPRHAWNWCRDKLWALVIDEARRAGRVVQISWEELSEGVASVEMEEQIQGEIDAQAFLDSLPEGLREMLQLRLQGYSWEETARLLGRNPNTLRSYLPDVRERFVEFFGYDPSKRASESFNRVAGENAPEVGGMDDEGTERSEEEFTDDTGSAGG